METDPPNELEVFRFRIERLEEEDLLILALLFEGRREGEIQKAVGMTEGMLRTRLKSVRRRLGLAHRHREILVWFYIQYLLAEDTRGTPLDPEKSSYTKPGEKLAEWTKWAQDRRAAIISTHGVDQRTIEAVLLLTRLQNVDKSYAQLGALMNPPLGISAYAAHISSMSVALGGGGRRRVFVMAKLAPLR
jgi:hypothetical protein